MNRLQERRLSLGLSQPDVSARLKEIDPRMDVGMVSRFERGACLPTLPVLEALETILQASRTELFGTDELGAIPESEVVGGTSVHPPRPCASVGRSCPVFQPGPDGRLHCGGHKE